MTTTSLAQQRIKHYIVLFLSLVIGFYFTRNSTWEGSTQLHTAMEIVATLLAFIVGTLALIRFYSRKNNTILFIGAGFLGTAFLDGYHCIVTSTVFSKMMPSAPPSLSPWSWLASRVFLAILLFASWLAWRREAKLGEKGRINEKIVYVGMGLFTLACFFFFIFYPLPPAYYPELFFGRPEEFVPAFFFLLALVGYFIKGDWKQKEHYFDHWLIYALIVNFVSQTMFMSFSFRLFDGMFDAAHLLKKVSYICTLTGLLISMFFLFRTAEESKERIEDALEKEEQNRRQKEQALKFSEESKEVLQQKTEELERINRIMVDRELKMIELKKEIKVLKENLEK